MKTRTRSCSQPCSREGPDLVTHALTTGGGRSAGPLILALGLLAALSWMLHLVFRTFLADNISLSNLAVFYVSAALSILGGAQRGLVRIILFLAILCVLSLLAYALGVRPALTWGGTPPQSPIIETVNGVPVPYTVPRVGDTFSLRIRLDPRTTLSHLAVLTRSNAPGTKWLVTRSVDLPLQDGNSTLTLSDVQLWPERSGGQRYAVAVTDFETRQDPGTTFTALGAANVVEVRYLPCWWQRIRKSPKMLPLPAFLLVLCNVVTGCLLWRQSRAVKGGFQR